jgi:hypothetical protein
MNALIFIGDLRKGSHLADGALDGLTGNKNLLFH